MIQTWRLQSDETLEQFPWKISDDMYKQNLDNVSDILSYFNSNKLSNPLFIFKTYNNLRLRDLLVEYSQSSALIVLTIPVPNKTHTCAGLFISWLDYVSNEMPPMLMVRGNQTPVLTFYS